MCLGAIVAVFVGRLLQALLFEVGASDPISLAIATITFGVATVAAGLVPAYRASRIDLVESLRQE